MNFLLTKKLVILYGIFNQPERDMQIEILFCREYKSFIYLSKLLSVIENFEYILEMHHPFIFLRISNNLKGNEINPSKWE